MTSREGELWATATAELRSALETLEEYHLEELQPAYLRGGKEGDVVAKENIKTLDVVIPEVEEAIKQLLKLREWVERRQLDHPFWHPQGAKTNKGVES